MIKLPFFVFFLSILFQIQAVVTKYTMIEIMDLSGYNYEYSSAGRTYHIGCIIIDICFTIVLISYILRKIFFENNMDNFIRKKNAQTIYIIYRYFLSTGMNLQNIFNGIKVGNNGIVAAQYGTQRKRIFGYPGIKKKSSAYLTLLFNPTKHANNKFDLIKIKIFSNGQVILNIKNHGLFENVNQQLLNFLNTHNNEYNFFKGKILVKKLTARFLYRMDFNRGININNIKFNNNKSNSNHYKICLDKRNIFPKSCMVKFGFNGTSNAYAKIHSNGNVYIYTHYFARFYNHKYNLKIIFQALKNII